MRSQDNVARKLQAAGVYLAAFVMLGLGVRAAQAQAPATIPVTGVLTDSSGAPVNGAHRITFGVFDVDSGSSALFTDDYSSLELQDGHFTVYLGSQSASPLDLTLFRDHGELWLETVIDGTEIIAPRIKLATVPYAAFAQYSGDRYTDAEAVAAVAAADAYVSNAGDDAIAGALTVGNAGGGRWLTLNDVPDARWSFSTGGYDLSVSNDNDGTPDGTGGGSWTTRLIVNEKGNVGIGTTVPQGDGADLTVGIENGTRGTIYLYGSTAGALSSLFTSDGNLHIDSAAAHAIYLNWYGGNGVNIGNGGSTFGPITASGFTTASSRRFKKDIRRGDYGMAEVRRLVPKRFQYRQGKGREEIGLIAEEVATVLPEVVSFDEQGKPSGVDYSKLSVVLLGAVKEQQATIDELTPLREENQRLEGRIARLEKTVESLLQNR